MKNTPIEMHELYNPAMKNSPQWQFVSDQVMGGVSQGQVFFNTDQESPCHCLTGLVSLENNGGFLQMQLVDLEQLNVNFGEYQGLFIEVKGNQHRYNLHIRTSQLWLPWQSFRQSFDVTDKWQRIFLPFDGFTAYKTFARLDAQRIKRLGILAIGEAFQANICIRSLGLYK
ncbi:MAG TPA: hypothetical protein ENK73_05870 [Thiomicrospira sp.]|nr:hypothetical protein [Thiomicrospira sp.]